MEAVEVLVREHKLVRRMLQCLRVLVRDGHQRGSLDPFAAGELLALFECFVDGNHQDKEELHLFPHLLARATPEEAQRLEKLFDEHSAERRRLIGMRLHLEGAREGDATSLDHFEANARVYARLQQAHLEEENAYVLPLARVLLDAADDRRILDGYAQIDGRLGQPRDVLARLVALERRLLRGNHRRPSSRPVELG